MYPAELVVPMKEELTDNGFKELLTPEDVDNQLKQEGTTLVMINSVCGCSAGTARPGVLMAVANSDKKPDHLTTSFAGFDIDALDSAREQYASASSAPWSFPPSMEAVACRTRRSSNAIMRCRTSALASFRFSSIAALETQNVLRVVWRSHSTART